MFREWEKKKPLHTGCTLRDLGHSKVHENVRHKGSVRPTDPLYGVNGGKEEKEEQRTNKERKN